MPALREFELKDPEMMVDRFFVEIPEGPDWQCWRSEFWGGEQVQLWYEEEQTWLSVAAASWYIEDGSGNAPGANAHFFWKLERDGKHYRLDMGGGQRLRLEAPTTEELIARPKYCESQRLIEEETQYNPARYGTCYAKVTRRVAGSWYCEEHAEEIVALLTSLTSEKEAHRNALGETMLPVHRCQRIPSCIPRRRKGEQVLWQQPSMTQILSTRIGGVKLI